MRVWSDFDDVMGGNCGLQVLEDGTKAVILSLWDVFCEQEAGHVPRHQGALCAGRADRWLPPGQNTDCADRTERRYDRMYQRPMCVKTVRNVAGGFGR